MEKSFYDIAVLGGGCSGFQLLHQMSQKPDWMHKKVALFNDDAPQKRSWCFWSKVQHPLQHLVKKSWSTLTFKGRDFLRTENIAPYQYHYIPGEAFFDYFQNQFLTEHKNITPLNHTVTSVEKKDMGYRIQNNVAHWEAENVFSSLPPNLEKGGPSVFLHFYSKIKKILCVYAIRFSFFIKKSINPFFDFYCCSF